MKKLTAFLIVFFFLGAKTRAQQGVWTWINGNVSGFANYGVKGVPDTNNLPLSTYEAADWVDLNGNFWMFSGSNYTSDMWMYNPATNIWTWMNGPGTSMPTGAYGIKGIPSPQNYPPPRIFGSINWVDQSGDLWLYSGNIFDASIGVFRLLNDLWRYHIPTNEWTWMRGDSAGTIGSNFNYGIKGIPFPTNECSPRIETHANWIDSTNHLWLFGGEGDNFNFRNDVWYYDVGNNVWAWMNGDSSFAGSVVYDSLGVFTSSNNPGGRWTSAHWIDKQGKFWMYGGLAVQGNVNDLWIYDTGINQWAWMWGDTNKLNVGWGQLCSCDTTHYPGNRMENKMCWTDTAGNFFMYGGGLLPNDFADMWKFDPQILKWTFINGKPLTNINPTYGTIGVSNPANNPGSVVGASYWKDTAGNFYMFGGITNALDNVIWKYTYSINCTSNYPGVAFQSADTSNCEKACIDFTDLTSNNPISWQWFFPGADSLTSTLQNPTGICYNAYGSFDVTLIACNCSACDTLTLPNYIHVYQNPPPPVIVQSNDTLICTTNANGYQWYLNNVAIAGATQSTYVSTQQGLYYVIITDSNQCNAASNAVLINSINQIENQDFFVSIIPNPNYGSFTLEINTTSEINKLKAQIINALGEIVYENDFENVSGNFSKQINLKHTAKGTYSLKLWCDTKVIEKKIILH